MAEVKENKSFNSVSIGGGGLKLSMTDPNISGSDIDSTREGILRYNKLKNVFEGYTGIPHDGENPNQPWRELTLDIASESKLGGIKIGSNLSISPTGVLAAVSTGSSRFYQNVITISPNLGAADYQTITAAILYINQIIDPVKMPSITNQYKLLLSPAIYQENIILPDYVSIQGESSGLSVIKSITQSNDINDHPIITLGKESRVEDLELNHLENSSAYVVAIYGSNTSNNTFQNLKIVLGDLTYSYSPGSDIYGIYLENCINSQFNNINVNITNGTNIIYGLYLTNVKNAIIYNSIINIDTTPKIINDIPYNDSTNYIYGVYHNNKTTVKHLSNIIEIKGAEHNIGIKNNNSGSELYFTKIYSSSYNNYTAYGIENNSTQYQSQIYSNEIEIISNTSSRDIISLPNGVPALSFLPSNYIKIEDASNDKNNSSFYIENIYKNQNNPNSPINIILGYDKLQTESSGNWTRIYQYHTIKLNSCIIEGSNSPINTLSQHFAIESNNTTFKTSLNGPIMSGSLLITLFYHTYTVAIQGGDFTHLADAINAISDNNEFNRYNINVKAGIYEESQKIILKPYINVIGESVDTTILNFDIYSNIDTETGSCIILTSNTEINNLTIQNKDKSNAPNGSGTYRNVIYGNLISDSLLNNLSINVTGYQNHTCSAIYLNNSSSHIYQKDVNINITGGLNNSGWIYENSTLDIKNGNITIDSISDIYSQNNIGIESEKSNININGTKIIIKNNSPLASSYGIKTINNDTSPTPQQYLIQFFSLNLNILGYDNGNGENEYSIYTSDNQTIVGGNSNLIGNVYYNLANPTSILNTYACWGAKNVAGVVVSYPLNNNGIQLPPSEGNLFIGDNSGNLNISGTNNTAVGNNTGSSLTSASDSTLFGYNAGNSITSGVHNTFIGSEAGNNTTIGTNNTFTGKSSGSSNTTGDFNSAYGAFSLTSNTTGDRNIAIGYDAGSIVDSSDNLLIGVNSAKKLTNGFQNIIIGNNSGATNQTGIKNTLIGYEAGFTGLNFSGVVSVGHQSGYLNQSDNNVFVGSGAGYGNTTGNNQVIIGNLAGYSQSNQSGIVGNNNTMIGSEAGFNTTTGSSNVLLGYRSGFNITSGSRNLLFGATSNLTTGSDNIIFGSEAGNSLTTASSNILLGTRSGNSLTLSSGTVAIGYESGSSQTTQTGSVFLGYKAGKNTIDLSGNVIIIGYEAGSISSSISSSILIGREAGQNIKGSYNIGIGYQSLKNQTNYVGLSSATGNVFMGNHSGMNVSIGSRNTGIGGGTSDSRGVLSNIQDHTDNTAIGFLAGTNVRSSYNTLLGGYAGLNLLSGDDNTMIGYRSGNLTTTGKNSVYIGSSCGFSGTTATDNTYVGFSVGFNNKTGKYNTLLGVEAGYKNLVDGIVAIGYYAGRNNTSANNNIFIGREAGSNIGSILSGTQNIMIGYKSGFNNTTGSQNLFIGSESGLNCTSGEKNVLIGNRSGYSLTIGQRNVFIGSNNVGYQSENSNDNIFIGEQSGLSNVDGNRNLFIGTESGKSSINSSDNICFGAYSGYNIIDENSNYNIYVGNESGYRNTGKQNVCIGYKAGSSQGTQGTVNFNNVISIGYQAALKNKTDNLIAIGPNASRENTSGINNISIGYNAGKINTDGTDNINIGTNAGSSLVSSKNIFIGSNSGANVMIGENNTFIGNNSGTSNINGNNNLFFGYQSGSNSLGNNNVMIGSEAGLYNVQGEQNLYIGYHTGRNALTSNNLFIGNEAGLLTTTGSNNLLIGNQAGRLNTIGQGNFFIGYQSGYSNTTGNYGSFLGYHAGYNNTIGINNLFYGYESGKLNISGSNNLAIGVKSQKYAENIYNNISLGSNSLINNTIGNNNLIIGSNSTSTGNIGNNNMVMGSNSSQLIANPSFQNNIIAGYRSNFQGFSSKDSIVIGANAVNIGSGGESNIIIGENTALNLGLGNAPTYSTIPCSVGTNVIGINSNFVKKGQYIVIVYDSNNIITNVKEPQIVYTTSVSLTTSTISELLKENLSATSNEKIYLLFGRYNSVIINATSGNDYFTVMTPLNSITSLFNVNDIIILQAFNQSLSENVVIKSFSLFSGDNNTGTTKIEINNILTNTYQTGDVIYLGRLRNTNIGELDTSNSSANIIIGSYAGNQLTTGSKNIAFGDSSLKNITTQKYNTAIGTGSGFSVRSENNLLLGTKAGYYLDSGAMGITGLGGNTMIGYASGQFAGYDNDKQSNNNLYIGNKVAQVNQGSNNIFIGNESETLQSADAIGKTTYSDKLAIYNSDSGIPSNPLIGGDLNTNKIGISTIEPNSTLDVNGSFGKSIVNISQFDTNLDYNIDNTYQYPVVCDKNELSILLQNIGTTSAPITSTENITSYVNFSASGNALVNSEFLYHDNKYIDINTGLPGFTNITRGLYNSTQSSHLNGSRLYDIRMIQDTEILSANLVETGIISLESTQLLPNDGLIVIDSEIIQYTGKNGGLGNATRGYLDTVATFHDADSLVFNLSNSIEQLIFTPLTRNINATTSNIPLNTQNFLPIGCLIIDNELMSYQDNTPYIFDVDRGSQSISAIPHSIGSNVYLVSDDTNQLVNSYLASPISQTPSINSLISLTSYQSFENTGYIIVDSEIIKYGNIALSNVVRDSSHYDVGTSGFYIPGTLITLISDGVTDLFYNYLDQEIDENGIFDIGGFTGPIFNPGISNINIDYNDAIIIRNSAGFPENGTILIEKEIIKYNNKYNDYIYNLTRGAYETIPSIHQENSKVYVLNDSIALQGITGLIDLTYDGVTTVNFTHFNYDFPIDKGTVLIDQEICKYNGIRLNNINRGFSNSQISQHIINDPVYNFANLLSTQQLSSPINGGTTNIPINNNSSLSTYINGTILINNELIIYIQGSGLRGVSRAQFGTSSSNHDLGANVFDIPFVNGSVAGLTTGIQAYETGIPVDDNTNFSTSGLILIDAEIIAFQNKNTLDNVIRGALLSTPSKHNQGAQINQLIDFTEITELDAKLNSYDDAIIISDLAGFTVPPGTSETIFVETFQNNQIVGEFINYNKTGNSLATLNNQNRGLFNSGNTAHLSGTNVYELITGNSINLGHPVINSDLAIAGLESSGITHFPTSGRIRVGHELINYTRTQHSLGTNIRNYRQGITGITQHLYNTPVYNIEYDNQLSLPLPTGITALHQILPTDLTFPVNGDISDDNDYGISGHIIVNDEIINYSSKQRSLVLTNISQRGKYNSVITSHSTGETGYLFDTIIDSGITVENISSGDSGNTGYIILNSVNGFPESGNLRVDREIITYKNVNSTLSIDRINPDNYKLGLFPASHTYGTLAYKFNFVASAELLNSILVASTTLNFTNETFIMSSSGEIVVYDPNTNTREIMLYGSKVGNTLYSLTRAQRGTTALNFTVGGANPIKITNFNTSSNSGIRSDLSNTSLYVPVFNQAFANSLIAGEIILIDNEFMYIKNKTSLDGIYRNQYESLSYGDTNNCALVSSDPHYSNLRNNVSINHLFLPFESGLTFNPTPGNILLGSEWITYNNKNTFDINSVASRAKYGTISVPIGYKPNVPVLIVQNGNINSYRNLRNDLTPTGRIVSLDGINTSYNTDSANGLILIDNEFMTIGSKDTFDFDGLTFRGLYNTNIFNTTNPSNTQISLISGITANSTLRNNITSDYKFIPLVNGSDYGITGLGLIDAEFFTWEHKKSLDNLIRGVSGTTAITQDINSSINIVAKIQNLPKDSNGYYQLNSITINGDKVLLSDTVSGIRIDDSSNMENYPSSGTVIVNGEQISYNTKSTLADITRGTNGTSNNIKNHLNGSRIYLIDTNVNNSITYKTLAFSLSTLSSEIQLNNTTGLSMSGLVIINSELISYFGINGNKLLNCLRARYNTSITPHNVNSTVYIVPITNINNMKNTKLTQTLYINDLITSVIDNSNFGNSGTILIGNEIMTYKSKNALGKLTRGVNSTNIFAYPDQTPIQLVNISLGDLESTILVDSSLNTLTIDLPQASLVKGRIYTIKKIVENNQVIIDPYQLETIDGNETFILSNINTYVEIQSDGIEWKIITQSDIYRQINTVTQNVSLSTAVTINSSVGIIQTYSTTLNFLGITSFTVYNNNVSAGDLVFTQIITDDDDTPNITVKNITNGSFKIVLKNMTGYTPPSLLPSQKIAFQIVKHL